MSNVTNTFGLVGASVVAVLRTAKKGDEVAGRRHLRERNGVLGVIVRKTRFAPVIAVTTLPKVDQAVIVDVDASVACDVDALPVWGVKPVASAPAAMSADTVAAWFARLPKGDQQVVFARLSTHLTK